MTDTYFALQALNQIRQEVIKLSYPSLLGTDLVPMETEAGMGVETYRYDILSETGRAVILANGAEDIPVVNANITSHYGRYQTLATSYKYTIKDLAAAQYSSQPLSAHLGGAARQILETQWDDIIMGESVGGLLGLPNQPSVLTITASANGNENGGTNSPLWIHKTPTQIYNELRSAAEQMRALSKGTFFPSHYLLPQAQFDLIAATPFPDNASGNSTILSFFKHTQSYSPTGVREIIPVPKIEGAFTGGLDGLIAYTPRLDYLGLKIGYDFTQEAPQLEKLTYMVPCHMSVGGVVLYKPASMIYLTGI